MTSWSHRNKLDCSSEAEYFCNYCGLSARGRPAPDCKELKHYENNIHIHELNKIRYKKLGRHVTGVSQAQNQRHTKWIKKDCGPDKPSIGMRVCIECESNIQCKPPASCKSDFHAKDYRHYLDVSNTRYNRKKDDIHCLIIALDSFLTKSILLQLVHIPESRVDYNVMQHKDEQCKCRVLPDDIKKGYMDEAHRLFDKLQAETGKSYVIPIPYLVNQ